MENTVDENALHCGSGRGQVLFALPKGKYGEALFVFK
jgi:hypothetical protein